MQKIRLSAATFVVLLSFACLAHGQTDAVETRLTSLVSETSRLSREDEASALAYLQKQQSESISESSVERLSLGNLLITQYLHLNRFDEAAKKAEELLVHYPDQDFEFGLFSFGQKAAVRALLRFALEHHEYTKGLVFWRKALASKPGWGVSPDPSVAIIWSLVGDLYYHEKEVEKAMEAWSFSLDSYRVGRLEWLEAEPENFRLYQGRDRFNPLQIQVEAKLLAGYVQAESKWEADALLREWARVQEGIGLSHAGDEGFAQRSHRSSVHRALEKAQTLFALPGFAETFRLHPQALETCAGELTAQVQPMIEEESSDLDFNFNYDFMKNFVVESDEPTEVEP